jgi:hypothetical protein
LESGASRTSEAWTFLYEGEPVPCRTTPEGIEVLAVGWEEVGRFFEEAPPENRQGVVIVHP